MKMNQILVRLGLFIQIFGTQVIALTTASGPSIILYNGNVIPEVGQASRAQAIAIEGNRITAVGNDIDILAL